ncbi:MAG: SurA N-terminal domain-containing protein [Xanthomonadales bacterium]|nr:SurA N-terminal domain-containing protein [Xanthomonadales bacterium]
MVLQAIRERLTGIAAIFIFAILIIPFAFVGVGSYFASDAVNLVARVNDSEITTAEFTTSFQNYRRRMQALLGDGFDPVQFEQPIIKRQHLDNMIDRELVAQVSLSTGLAVDDEALAAAIRDSEFFQVDGQFNQEVYQSRLIAMAMTPAQYENEMRAELIMDQYPGTIMASAIATDFELKELARLQDQSRAFQAMVVNAKTADTEAANDQAEQSADAEAQGEVADAGEVAEDIVESAPAGDETELLAWYEANPNDYRSAEQVIVEYLELEASTLANNVEPDEDQLQARFDEQKARFVTPESRMASHILIEISSDSDEAAIETARQKARDIAEQAQDGADFAELARTYSNDAGSANMGGDLGWVEPGFMVKAFEDALYALTLAKPLSEPVQTGFGWHVIRLEDIRPAEGMSFEEARETLHQEYIAEQQDRQYLEQADRLVDLIYEDPTTLTAAAEALDLEIKQIGPFGRTGGEGLAANSAVVDAAFSDLVLTQASVSDPVDIGENHMIMLKLNEYLPEAIKPFKAVREEVVAAVSRDKAIQAASAKAAALLARVQNGEDITALAEEAGIELLVAEDARREGSPYPAQLVSRIFRMLPPEGDAARLEVLPLDNGYAVVRLTAVTDGELTEDDLIRQQNYRRRIANGTANSETYGFLRMLRSQSDIEVYEDRL